MCGVKHYETLRKYIHPIINTKKTKLLFQSWQNYNAERATDYNIDVMTVTYLGTELSKHSTEGGEISKRNTYLHLKEYIIMSK